MSEVRISEEIVNFLESAQSTAESVEVSAGGFSGNWPPPGRYEANVLGIQYHPGKMRDADCVICQASYSCRVTNDPNYDPEKILEFQGRELRLVPDFESVFTGDSNSGIRTACRINWEEFIKMHALLGWMSVDDAKANIQNAVGATQNRLSEGTAPVAVIIVKHNPGKSGGVFPEERLVDVVSV